MKKNDKKHLDKSNDNSGNKIIKDVSDTNITLNITPPSDISNVFYKDTTNSVITINPLFDKITPINIINYELFNKSKTNDINEHDPSLNMITNSILDNFKKKNKGRLEYIKIGLDNITQKNEEIINTVNNKIDTEKDIFKFLKNVTDKYNLINNNTTKLIEDYAGYDNNLKIPPVPPIPPSPPPIPIRNVVIDRDITSIDNLLSLINDYPLEPHIHYNINMVALHNIKEPLFKLNQMIGMSKLKQSVVDQIIYFMQGLDKNNDFMHTVIYGPPGTGKTEIAEMLGKIFSSLGILKRNIFKKVTRSDLIAGYLGQTAIKTKEVVEQCLGGVLFIDEAYALGNVEKRDSFAKECIDTLCESLSAYKSSLMVIIAGYEEDLNKCFFSYNQGLNSRFPWRFNTNDYTATELNEIFNKKINDIKWSIKEPVADEWFENKKGYFKYFGRDIEVLLAKIKIVHARRVFCKPLNEKTVITLEDIDNGFNLFTDNTEVNSRVKTIDTSYMKQNMYL